MATILRRHTAFGLIRVGPYVQIIGSNSALNKGSRHHSCRIVLSNQPSSLHVPARSCLSSLQPVARMLLFSHRVIAFPRSSYFLQLQWTVAEHMALLSFAHCRDNTGYRTKRDARIPPLLKALDYFHVRSFIPCGAALVMQILRYLSLHVRSRCLYAGISTQKDDSGLCACHALRVVAAINCVPGHRKYDPAIMEGSPMLRSFQATSTCRSRPGRPCPVDGPPGYLPTGYSTPMFRYSS